MGETTKYDVAVLGLWWSSNYGSIMTYYSLYRLIESYGYRTVIIDRPGIGHMSDGSTYPVGHTIITANGIKPSSVMSWIHREKPGSPEWEHRARQRFMEQNGGDWHSAS